MIKNLKKIIVTILYMIVMFLCVLAAILYAEGYYDITFIERNQPEEKEEYEEIDEIINIETSVDTSADVGE